MTKTTAVFLTLVTAISQLFGLAGDPEYVKTTGGFSALKILLEKKEYVSAQYTGKESTCLWDESAPFSFEGVTELKKEKNRDFKILTLSDIHFSDFGYRAFFSLHGVNVIKKMVVSTQPDLIVLMGDFVCGDNSTYYSIHRITDLMESFGVPWAPVFGNHDDESNCDLNYLADVMMTSPHCLMRKGDPEMGVGNYIINISENDENGDSAVVESLFLMDSHHGAFNEKQQRWFKWAADGINTLTDNGAEISLYMHIPLPEYETAYNMAWDSGKKCWRDGFEAYGRLHEPICCEHDENGNPRDRGMFELIKNSKSTKYVFCAHDHMNDFSLKYEGVRLTYTMKLGHASGFQFGYDGATLIRVGSNGIDRITHKTTAYGPTVNIVDIFTEK